MPYANRTAYARQTRAYIADKKRRLPDNTTYLYRLWLEQLGERLDWPDPKTLSVKALENLETDMMAQYSESTIVARLSVLRDMLTFSGNKDAHRFKMLCSMQPARDSVFMSEELMARCRLTARSMSNRHELIFTLMADNGLRPVDIQRLTMQNIRELLDSGESVIIGKGRKGGKPGKLVLSPMSRKPIMLYLAERRTLRDAEKYEQFVLTLYRRKAVPVSRGWLYDRSKEVFATVGMDAKPRDLRKTCGNRVYKETRDLAMAAMILRHSSPGTTFRHYIGADSVEMRDVQARLAHKNPDWSSQQDTPT